MSGSGGLDEISTTGPSVIYATTQQGVRRSDLDVRSVGIELSGSPDGLIGGTARDNVQHFERIITGADQGPRHHIVTLNAGAALVVAGQARDLRDGVARAQEALRSGAVADLVQRMTAFTKTHATRPAS